MPFPCYQVELLLLVGAPTQAFERVAGRFYSMIEWIERNVLGWELPDTDDTLPMYENIALYYPEEHAYTYDAYRWGPGYCVCCIHAENVRCSRPSICSCCPFSLWIWLVLDRMPFVVYCGTVLVVCSLWCMHSYIADARAGET